MKTKYLQPAFFLSLLMLFLALPSTSTATAAECDESDGRNYTLTMTPYAWMMDLKGTAGAKGHSLYVDAPFTTTSKHLNFAAMLAVDAIYKNSFGITSNLNLAMLGGHEAVKGVSLNSRSSMFMSDASALYRVASIPFSSNPKAGLDIDLLAGVRVWRVGLKLDVASGSKTRQYSQNETWADPVLGARAIVRLNEKWNLRFRGGYGGFSTASKKTWDVSALVGYKIKDRINLVAGYRAVGVDYRKDRDRFIFDVALRGPIIGATFSF